jgi:LPS-assembly lipoprotein
MNKLANFTLFGVAVFGLIGCGFHLRGVDGDYQFPYKTVYLECDTPVICPAFKTAITKENLTKLVAKESAEATIVVSDEETNRAAYNYNSVGQIASYKLTYQVTARIYNKQGIQTAPDMKVMGQEIMNYNNSLILSANQQEEQTWDQIHQNVVTSLIRRIVYSHPYLVSPVNNAAESK